MSTTQKARAMVSGSYFCRAEIVDVTKDFRILTKRRTNATKSVRELSMHVVTI